MNNLISDLKKLDLVILKNLESSIVSIYKINKEHHLFKPILEKYPKLNNAEYIIYPNINNNNSKIFLDYNGTEILSYDGGISEFVLLPSDLYVESQSIIIDESLITTNCMSNYSWQ